MTSITAYCGLNVYGIEGSYIKEAGVIAELAIIPACMLLLIDFPGKARPDPGMQERPGEESSNNIARSPGVRNVYYAKTYTALRTSQSGYLRGP
jgi:hypothetical protein